jgi:hypothetical protein
MTEKKSYPAEMFDWREARYRAGPRTVLPHREALEAGLRVNALVGPPARTTSLPAGFEGSAGKGAGRSLPLDLFSDRFEFDPIWQVGRLVGVGGAVVVDGSTCMIGFARGLLGALKPESCGACTVCRIGVERMVELLDRIEAGEGRPEDLQCLNAVQWRWRRGSFRAAADWPRAVADKLPADGQLGTRRTTGWTKPRAVAHLVEGGISDGGRGGGQSGTPRGRGTLSEAGSLLATAVAVATEAPGGRALRPKAARGWHEGRSLGRQCAGMTNAVELPGDDTPRRASSPAGPYGDGEPRWTGVDAAARRSPPAKAGMVQPALQFLLT